MYIATQNFKAYMVGEVKEGQEVSFNKTWLDAGMIKEVESKPVQKKEIETKPKKQKKETK
ncbi:MAG: hypothetical protein ACPG5L_10950 [Vibrio gallaecicus]